MRNKRLFLLTASMISLVSCGATPGPDYGADFNTPEFFLARLNPKSTKVTISSAKLSIEDTNLKIRDEIFSRDSFLEKNEFKPTTKEYFCYNTILENSSNGLKFAEMYVYKDGSIKIDYKEQMYKKISFYSSMDVSDAEYLYDFVEKTIYSTVKK